MQASMNDNSSSLSLALDARMAIKALRAFQKGGKADDALMVAAADIATSLRALHSGGPLFANLSRSSSFESYDQIQTLKEVKSDFKEDVEAKLDLIANGNPDQQGIEFAIDFFSALERRARQKFNRSSGFGI